MERNSKTTWQHKDITYNRWRISPSLLSSEKTQTEFHPHSFPLLHGSRIFNMLLSILYPLSAGRLFLPRLIFLSPLYSTSNMSIPQPFPLNFFFVPWQTPAWKPWNYTVRNARSLSLPVSAPDLEEALAAYGVKKEADDRLMPIKQIITLINELWGRNWKPWKQKNFYYKKGLAFHWGKDGI